MPPNMGNAAAPPPPPPPPHGQAHGQQQHHHQATTASWKTWQSDQDVMDRKALIQQILQLFRHRKPNVIREWCDKLPDFVRRLEEALYKSARTKEEYTDPNTLESRLQNVARRMVTRQASQATQPSAGAMSVAGQPPMVGQQQHMQQQMAPQQHAQAMYPSNAAPHGYAPPPHTGAIMQPQPGMQPMANGMAPQKDASAMAMAPTLQYGTMPHAPQQPGSAALMGSVARANSGGMSGPPPPQSAMMGGGAMVMQNGAPILRGQAGSGMGLSPHGAAPGVPPQGMVPMGAGNGMMPTPGMPGAQRGQPGVPPPPGMAAHGQHAAHMSAA
eukprot:CAMPEP_0119202076 /NCGR_PEP_ID=MMETSP1316-20130426/31002_1 /TAXON_ID=41880 /ORGANISM="Pycnococcus provasolii, Strain RCC2336" /LENGTH=327 /DNA_ID=CAMNT_0007198249 /DNA_START=234 /DNA_END=1213 /DNA_ORIENTATION=-